MKKISLLFFINGIFNALGGVLLFLFSDKLAYGLNISQSANFLWYLLGAASITLAVISFYGVYLKERVSIQAIRISLMTFHGLSALVSVWAITNGMSSLIWINATIHIIFFALFYYFGLTSNREEKG